MPGSQASRRDQILRAGCLCPRARGEADVQRAEQPNPRFVVITGLSAPASQPRSSSGRPEFLRNRQPAGRAVPAFVNLRSSSWARVSRPPWAWTGAPTASGRLSRHLPKAGRRGLLAGRLFLEASDEVLIRAFLLHPPAAPLAGSALRWRKASRGSASSWRRSRRWPTRWWTPAGCGPRTPGGCGASTLIWPAPADSRSTSSPSATSTVPRRGDLLFDVRSWPTPSLSRICVHLTDAISGW